MACLRVLFANICQGLTAEGQKNQTDVFSRYWPSAYREVYLPLNPDIACLAEAPLDDAGGTSSFLSALTADLGAAACRADVLEKSWLVEGKYYGNAIISRFALKEYQTMMLPNPRLEVDNADGSHWVLHDKTVQTALLEVGSQTIRLVNLHYFPFHRFRHNLNEPGLRPVRAAFIEQLRLDDNVPTIVTGDFNNADDELRSAFPELFENGRLEQAVLFGPEEFHDYYGRRFQIDHILYTPRDFSLVRGQVVRDPSDHRCVVADLELRL